MSGEILTAEQLAEAGRSKLPHVYRMTRAGAIPAFRSRASISASGST